MRTDRNEPIRSRMILGNELNTARRRIAGSHGDQTTIVASFAAQIMLQSFKAPARPPTPET